MKKIRLLFLALTLMLAGASSAYAHGSVGFSVNLGFPGYYAAPPPVYYSAPPVVYYRPVPAYYNYYDPSVYYRPFEPRYRFYDRDFHHGWHDHDRFRR